MLKAELVMFIETTHGSPYVLEKLEPIRPDRLDVITHSWRQFKAFDCISRYEMRPDRLPSYTWLQKFLAYTVYSPRDEVEVTWHVVGECKLEDIVAEVERGLETDDDSIQQWFTGEDVLKLLRAATTFEEMCDMVECINGRFESDPRLYELVESVLGAR